MIKYLSNKEFYTLVARLLDYKNPNTIKKIWEAAQEVIIRECINKKCCALPGIGNIDLVYHKEYYQRHIVDGKEKIYHVPERYTIKFTPKDGFVNDVNQKGVSKLYRKRMKNDLLTKQDIERQIQYEMQTNEPIVKDQKQVKEELKDMFNMKTRKKEKLKEINDKKRKD